VREEIVYLYYLTYVFAGMEIRLKRSDFKTGEKKKIDVNGRGVVIFCLGPNKFFAFDDKCPHLGCDIFKYGVIIKEELICQCHFSHFSIYDGNPRKGASKKPIKTYKIKIEDDNIVIYE